MGFLSLAGGLPNHQKALFSFWFKVTDAALTANYNSWTGNDDIPFDGILPLVVWGDNNVNKYEISAGSEVADSHYTEIWQDSLASDTYDGFYHLREGPDPYDGSTQYYNLGSSILRPPCFIGIDSNRAQIEDYDPEDPDGPPPVPNVLRICLQMSDLGTGSNIIQPFNTSIGGNRIIYEPNTNDGATRDPSGADSFHGPDRFGNLAIAIDAYNPLMSSVSAFDASSTFIQSNSESFNIKLQNKRIIANRWHHVVFSCDLSGAITAVGIQVPDIWSDLGEVPDHGSIESSLRGYVAFDDVNYKGAAMRDKWEFSEYETSRLDFEDNGLYNYNAMTCALTRQAANGDTGEICVSSWTFQETRSGFGEPNYSYSPTGVQSSGNDIAVPVTSQYADKNEGVIMAEMQVFTDVSGDTADEAIRRLFVDSRGKYVPIGAAEDFFGKAPDVALGGTSDKWIAGTNQGSAGNFEKTGTIEVHRNGPAL
jgi:hypothetical protein